MKNIPKDVKIEIVKEQKNHWCIVLHEPPQGHEQLSEDELKKASGGFIICANVLEN